MIAQLDVYLIKAAKILFDQLKINQIMWPRIETIEILMLWHE